MTTQRSKYLAYVRVSSYEQAERNISIPSQIDQVRQYAKQNNIQIEEILREEVSAFKGNRPVFNVMIQKLKKSNGLNWVIVFKFDRLSRNLDDFLKIDKVIREKWMEILSVTEPMLNSYLGRYLVRDMQNRAILYSEELSFRIKLWLRKKLQIWWSIWWWVPFWFKEVNWYFIPDETKSEIIQYVFNTYALWQVWYKELSKLVRRKFKLDLKTFTYKKIERIISNTIYMWVKTKTWILSNEEYLFWWVDNPWKYTETYEMKYITPLVSKEKFEKCQQIKNNRSPYSAYHIGKAKFPKIFQCICWRYLRRDDKKNIRYLSCSKQINNKFKVKCNEWYTQLWNIEKDIEKIVRHVLLTKEYRNIMTQHIQKEIPMKESEKNYKLMENLKKIDAFKEKLNILTESFVDWNITKQIFEISSNKINSEIELLKSHIDGLKNTEEYAHAWQKTIRFLEILWNYEALLENSSWIKISSQLFSTSFKVIANLILGSRKVSSKLYNQPFDIIQKFDISRWWNV